MPASELAGDRSVDSAATEDLVRKCRGWYDEYAFHKVYRAVYDFATVESERRLFRYLEGPAVYGCDRIRMRAAARKPRFTALTMRWCACWRPCWSFTTEEVWSYMRQAEGEPESVHLALFPEAGGTDWRVFQRSPARSANGAD